VAHLVPIHFFSLIFLCLFVHQKTCIILNLISICYLSIRISYRRTATVGYDTVKLIISSSQEAVFTSSLRNYESNLKLNLSEYTVPLTDLKNLNSKSYVEEIFNEILAWRAKFYKYQV
jgi:hypothetical protein